MIIRPQRQEVQKIVQIDLPVPLSIGIKREVHPSQFTGETILAVYDDVAFLVLVEHFNIVIIGLGRVFPEDVENPLRLLALEQITPSLTVGRRLRRELIRSRNIKFPVQHRIARRVFIHIGGAMADPLPGDEDRQLDMVFDLAHLERRGVPVAQQVVDKTRIVGNFLCALAVGHSGRLHDRCIVSHVVDHPDKAVIQNRQRFEQQFFEFGNGGTAGLRGRGFGRINFGSLFGGKLHVIRIPDVKNRAAL